MSYEGRIRELRMPEDRVIAAGDAHVEGYASAVDDCIDIGREADREIAAKDQRIKELIEQLREAEEVCLGSKSWAEYTDKWHKGASDE